MLRIAVGVVRLCNKTGLGMATNEPEIMLETPRFRVVRRRRQLADGTWDVREAVVHPGAAVILPLVDDDHVCLIRNYRIAVDEELIELPAGTIDPPRGSARHGATRVARGDRLSS